MTTKRPVPIDDLLAHRRLVNALAWRIVGDADRADDVAQDAWVSILRRPPRHQRGLAAWLARLVRNRAGDAWRADARRARLEQRAPSAMSTASAADTVAKVDAARRVVEAVAELPEPYRTTVVLRFYDDLSVAEIATRMAVPDATVRTRLSRAFARLRTRLGNDEEDREAWFALLLPAPRRKWFSGAAVPGAIAMSVKLWIGAGAAVALLVAALLLCRSDAAPHHAAAVPAVDAPTATRLRAPASDVAKEPTIQRDDLAVPTEPTGALVVEVRTLRDEPVAGAIVDVRRDAPDSPAATAHEAAGADGIARFPRLSGGAWSVVAHADGFAEANGSVIVPARSERKRTLYLDRGHELRGTVRDAFGRPVPGAFVDCVRQRPRPVVADATGAFVLTGLASGDVQLRAGRTAGSLSHRQIVSIPEVETCDIVLVDVRTVTVTGAVVDDATGTPLAGVAVSEAVTSPTPSVTDADGRFLLAGAGRDFLEVLTLTKDGYRRFAAPRAAAPVPATADVLDVGTLRMQHGATIEGVATSPEGPIEGAEIIITSPSRLRGSERRTARTDATGRYSFPSVEAGPTQFWATAPGFIAGETRARSGQIQAPESGTLRADFAFTRGAVVEGRVLDDDGHGVAGAYVVVDAMTTTDADGGFRCTGVAPRSGVPVLLMADGYARSDSTIDVPPGATSNVVLRLTRSPVVRGRLVARDGRAIENAHVLIVAGTSRDPSRITVNEPSEGPFPVRDDGSFEARVPGSATSLFTIVALTTSHAPSRSAPIAIVSGQREYAGVEVPLDAGTTIRGRVVSDGRGVSGAAVRLGFAGYGYTAPPIRANTDETGAFAIEHVVASFDGIIYVTAALDGYVEAVAKRAPDAAGDATLVLERPLDVSGIVETRDHEPLARLCVRADPLVPEDVGPIPPQHMAFTDGAGRFRVQGLRAGKYRLTVVRPGKPTAEREPIDAGAADVVLVVDR